MACDLNIYTLVSNFPPPFCPFYWAAGFVVVTVLTTVLVLVTPLLTVLVTVVLAGPFVMKQEQADEIPELPSPREMLMPPGRPSVIPS
jgi:hypothetical protein